MRRRWSRGVAPAILAKAGREATAPTARRARRRAPCRRSPMVGRDHARAPRHRRPPRACPGRWQPVRRPGGPERAAHGGDRVHRHGRAIAGNAAARRVRASSSGARRSARGSSRYRLDPRSLSKARTSAACSRAVIDGVGEGRSSAASNRATSCGARSSGSSAGMTSGRPDVRSGGR